MLVWRDAVLEIQYTRARCYALVVGGVPEEGCRTCERQGCRQVWEDDSVEMYIYASTTGKFMCVAE